MSLMSNIFSVFKRFFLLYFFKKKEKNMPDYEFTGNYKNELGKQMIVAKIIDSFGKSFKFPATDLILKRRDLLSKFSIDDIVNIVGMATLEKEPIVTFTKTTSHKFFAFLAMFYGVALVISNISSSKLATLFGITITGGVFPYLCTYVLGDIITEVYGYKRARQLIWGAVACNMLAIIFISIAIRLPASSLWGYQSQYELILGSTERVMISSMISYWCSEFLNSYILARLKIAFEGKYLGVRILLSSIISITLDTFLFIVISYAGNIPFREMIHLFIVSYIFGVIFEALSVPFAIVICNFLKKIEILDIFDVNTDFTPFSLDVSYNEKNNIKLDIK